MSNKSTLLCTFSTKKTLQKHTEEICNEFDIQFNKIFVLKNLKNDNEYYITYNVLLD